MSREGVQPDLEKLYVQMKMYYLMIRQNYNHL